MFLAKGLRIPSLTSRLLIARTMATSQSPLKSYIVSPAELSKALKDKPAGGTSRIIPLSAEWYLPNDPRKGAEEFKKLRLPGARFLDIDAVKDHTSPYPHMLPSQDEFTKAMSELGITRDDTVVLYDSPHIGLFSAPRAAWMFKVFKHPSVHLLNNFKLWVEQGFETETGAPIRDWEAASYDSGAGFDSEIVMDFEGVKYFAKRESREGVQILDARPLGRWLGKDPEPRPEISSGHVPGSVSVPFSEVLDPATKTFKSPEELRKIFLSRGVDPSSKTDKILMCGTGVTAVVLENALQIAGIEGERKVYDGSWTEWAQRVDKDESLIERHA